jgi:hypothetical protein
MDKKQHQDEGASTIRNSILNLEQCRYVTAVVELLGMSWVENKRMHTQLYSYNLKAKDLLEELNCDGRVNLKLI